mgnify:CR=1 FL=1
MTETEGQEQPTVLSTTTTQRKYRAHKGRALEVTGVPKKIEALFILLTDSGLPSNVPLNQYEIDKNPLTRDLPSLEKKAILEYWPRWNQYLDEVHAYKQQRVEVLKDARRTEHKVQEVKQSLRIGDMTLGNKLKAASQVFATEVVDASLRLAKTDVERALSDPTLKAMYDLRVKHAKDMLSLARQLNELGSTYELQEARGAAQYTVSDEVAEALANAQAKLIERGIPVNIVGEGGDVSS